MKDKSKNNSALNNNQNNSTAVVAVSGFGTVFTALLLLCCCSEIVGSMVAALGALLNTAMLFVTCVGNDEVGSGAIKKSALPSLVAALSDSALTICMGVFVCIKVSKVGGIAVCVIGVILLVAALFIYLLAVYKDNGARSSYSKRKHEEDKLKREEDRLNREAQHEDEMDREKHKRDMTLAKAQTSIAEQKIKTAKATETSKRAAVNVATVASVLGNVTSPKRAADYALESGAMEEGKRLADNLAQGALGSYHEPVDVNMQNATDSLKRTMDDTDAVFAKHVKALSESALYSLLVRGATQLGIPSDSRDMLDVATDVIQYTPDSYKDNIPDDLSDPQKAAFLIEKMGVGENEQ